jgi:hypothetical protein
MTELEEYIIQYPGKKGNTVGNLGLALVLAAVAKYNNLNK